MRYVAAYLLAVLGGKASPAESDIKKILDSVGVTADSDNIKRVIAALKGKDVEEIIAAGRTKLSSVMVASAPAGGAAAAGGGGGAAAAPAAKEEKKEEKKEDSDESDDDMGFGLFD